MDAREHGHEVWLWICRRHGRHGALQLQQRVEDFAFRSSHTRSIARWAVETKLKAALSVLPASRRQKGSNVSARCLLMQSARVHCRRDAGSTLVTSSLVP